MRNQNQAIERDTRTGISSVTEEKSPIAIGGEATRAVEQALHRWPSVPGRSRSPRAGDGSDGSVSENLSDAVIPCIGNKKTIAARVRERRKWIPKVGRRCWDHVSVERS